MSSIMEEAAGSKAARIQKLRLELKEWERAFAKAHDGRKPTREETKAEKGIGRFYLSSPLLLTIPRN
jgi:hypothetical protein